MSALARGYVWYPNLDADLEQLVRDCAVCRTLQVDIPHEQLVPWSWPTRRWQRVFIDFADYQGSHLLLGQDGHSKWPEVQIVADKTADTTVEVLRSWFARWGLPEELVCDNGPPFHSEAFITFLDANGVNLKHSPSYHTPSNGQIERGVQTVKACLEKQLLDNATSSRTLQHKIDVWLFAYRNTPHSVTRVAPAELFLGRRPRTKLSLVKPDQILKKKMEAVREKTKRDNPGKTTAFRPGDPVWVRSVVHRRVLWLKGVIQTAVSLVSYEVNVDGKVRHVSSSHLSPRSSTATCIDVDPVARLFATPVPETASGQTQTISVPELPAPTSVPVVLPFSPNPGAAPVPGSPVPDVDASPPVPTPVASPPVSQSSPGRSSFGGSSMESPMSTPQRTTSASTPRRMTSALVAQSPDPAPARQTRSGRQISKPKYLDDYVSR